MSESKIQIEVCDGSWGMTVNLSTTYALHLKRNNYKVGDIFKVTLAHKTIDDIYQLVKREFISI